MIEKTVRDYLGTNLQKPVYMETPERDIPSEYYLIEKTGSGEENRVSVATLAIKSISSVSLFQAATMNGALKSAMSGITTLAEVSKVKLNTDYNFTDTKTKQYRYQAVFDLVYTE